VETGIPSACATVDGKVCGIAIALYVRVITSGCNQRGLIKIQSSELEPVIYVTCTTLHVTFRLPVLLVASLGSQWEERVEAYLWAPS
jgi:sulfopyruvate decarboxylase TPP-binding subunit